jgi:hypothetical protein
MSLISSVKTAMNKQLLISESHGDSNRCTSCTEKPDTHNMNVSCVSPRTPLVRFLQAVSKRGNLSLAINSIGWTLLLQRKNAPNTIPSMSADRSVGPPLSFSPNITIEAVMKAKLMLTTCYIGLLGP